MSRRSRRSILITGGSGYIGSALVEYLKLDTNLEVYSYDILDNNDILDYDNLVDALKIYNITSVIHLAAMSSVTACNENPSEANQVNGYGTELILKAMKEAGCNNIIYASTSSVYGNSTDLPYVETQLPQPCSSYGSSKLLGEEAIKKHYETNLGSYLIFRMFNVVGTSGFKEIDNKGSAGYDRLFAALESGNLTIYGDDYPTNDGTGERDYIALKDVCKAYLMGVNLLDSEKYVRETINISTGSPKSVKQIVTSWNSKSTLPHVKYIFGPRREGDPCQVYGSNLRAHELLGWKPEKTMEDIINEISIDKNIPIKRRLQ